MSVLIAYGTIEGQTGKIARALRDKLVAMGEKAVLVDTSKPYEDDVFGGCESVILAGAVHERRHPEAFERFLGQHRDALADRRTLLLSVSLSAAFDEGLEEAQDYIDELKMRTGLAPNAELCVAGAIRTRKYGYYEKMVLRHVVLHDRCFEQNLKEYEFTDWEALNDTVQSFLCKVDTG